MTLQQLKYAIGIAELGSFHEAAKKLYISQPSLSFTIKGLEDELHMTMFTRSHKGTMLTEEGKAFIRDAKSIVMSADLLRKKHVDKENPRERFSISTQHYTFVSAAFAELVRRYEKEEYELTLNETKTLEVIDDVSRLRSEIGIIYRSAGNEPVIGKMLGEKCLVFSELFTTYPYILVGKRNPLAKLDKVDVDALTDYPCISFVQDDLAPHFFSEEAISILEQKKSIKISDRGALADLLDKTNAFVVSTGIYLLAPKAGKAAAIPLDLEEGSNAITLGLIRRKDSVQSELSVTFEEILDGIVKGILPAAREKRWY